MKVTKKFALAVFLFTFVNIVSAQETTSTESSSGFGIKGGLNYSTVSKGKFEEGPDPRTSFHLGFLGEIPLVPKVLSLQPEVVYSRQGFETNVKPLIG